jgi:glycine reductase complex component B subunit gamma
MLGVNRIVQGKAITSPVGDPSLSKEKEWELRRRYILKALELLQEDVEGPTVATLEDA